MCVCIVFIILIHIIQLIYCKSTMILQYKYTSSSAVLFSNLFILVVFNCATQFPNFSNGNSEIEIVRGIRYELGEIRIPYESDEIDVQRSINNELINRLRKICNNVSQDNEDIKYYRYDPRTNQCYSILFNEKGPCGKNMIFLEDMDNPMYGTCECSSEIRTLIYDPKTDQCYYIFQQAYCGSGKWLTLSRPSGRPLCRLNPCQNNSMKIIQGNGIGIQKPAEFVLFNNKCVQLGISTMECGPDGGEVIFTENKILPICSPIYDSEEDIQPGGYGGLFKPTNIVKPCAPGSLRSISGRCQSNWTW